MDLEDDCQWGREKKDVTIPKATMIKVFDAMRLRNVYVAKETRSLLADCCSEFIKLLLSETLEVCAKQKNKIIIEKHAIKALEDLGYGDYCKEARLAVEEHAKEYANKKRKKDSTNGLDEEEEIANQERMFEEARMLRARNILEMQQRLKQAKP